jgi:hypothetical protein
MTDLTLEALQTALAPIEARLARLEIQCTSIPLIWTAVEAMREPVRHVFQVRAALKDLALTRVSAGEVETVVEDIERLIARQSELEVRLRALEEKAS